MKKLLSILLAVVLVASVAAVAVSAYSVTGPDAIKVADAVQGYETYRYYFMMPNGTNGNTADADVTITTVDEETGESVTEVVIAAGEHASSWYNDFTDIAGIYWWGNGSAVPDGWAGYQAMVEDEAENVYYADVPKDVTTIVWNNAVDGGLDTTLDIYYKAAQTVNLNVEFLYPGENANFPNGIDNYDGLIYIVDANQIEINDFSLKQTCGGNWFYYYGSGCYGVDPEGTAGSDSCQNPVHNHSGEDDSSEETIPVDFVPGDANMDGEVSIMDATRIQRYLAELIDETEIDLRAALVTGGDEVSIMDATRIQRYLAELCNLDGSTPYDPSLDYAFTW